MITKKDLDISNVSYTAKDFTQIYPELLDLVKKITNKWNPEITDESDPGIVLIKLLAFIADKNNYNIDKNILEQFMPSATQESSVRKLTEMMGYNMKYYRSATTRVNFRYIGGEETLDDVLNNGGEILNLKAFDTSFKTEDNIIYTLLEDIQIDKGQMSSSLRDIDVTFVKTAMQGELKALNVNNSALTTEPTKIQLYNLDDNNRIYIPDTQVAENGIFINKEYYKEGIGNEEDYWRRVDNLNDQEIGSKVFKFGFDSSKQLPYIEFPSDISDLIGNGIEIWYLISSGANGAIKTGSLTQLNNWRFTDINGTDISISGSMNSEYYSLSNGDSLGGSNPETINEAYNNFKKTVGTFDTLVSPRDYSNAIYNYIDDETNTNVVSAVQVTDVRTDPNRSQTTLIRDINGLSYYKTILNSAEGLYDIILHGTKAANRDITNNYIYNSTYNALDRNDLQDIDNTVLVNNKTICHTLALPKEDDVNYILNKYILKCNISTKYKVNTLEQDSIINNIRTALFRAFNAREVDFGEEIPYDSILEVIQNSDERIKTVVLDDPKIEPYIVKGTGSESQEHKYTPYGTLNETESYTAGKDIDIVIKNILAARIQLYIPTNTFSLNYDMDFDTMEIYNNLVWARGSFKLLANKEKKLHSQEVVQVVEDSYLTEITYPAYVYYSFDSSIHTNSNNAIKRDTPYKLQQNEFLYIYYTDADDNVVVVTYKEGDIIQTTDFDLYNTLNGGAGANSTATRWLIGANTSNPQIVKEEQAGAIAMYALGTDEEILKLRRNEVNLNLPLQSCFWYIKPRLIKDPTNLTKYIIDNTGVNLIFEPENWINSSYSNTAPGAGIYTHILEEGEFFIYPSSDMTALYVLAEGTKLQINYNPSDNTFIPTRYEVDGDNVYDGTITLTRDNNQSIDIETLQAAIDSESIGTFQNSFNWEIKDFTRTNLTIIESSITTFIENEKIKSNRDLSEYWTTLNEGDSITYVNDETTQIVNNNNNYVAGNISSARARTVLFIEGNSITPQEIFNENNSSENNNDNEEIIICYNTVTQDENENDVDTYIQLKVERNFIQLYPVISSYKDIVLRQENLNLQNTTINGSSSVQYTYPYSCIIYNKKESDASSKNMFDLLQLGEGGVYPLSSIRKEYSIPVSRLVEYLGDETSITIPFSKDINAYVNVFNNFNGYTNLIEQNEDGDIVLEFADILKGIPSDRLNEYTVLISIPKILEINPLLTSVEDSSYNLLPQDIDTILTNIKEVKNFDYLAEVNQSKLITSYDPVNSFFDYNNVFNSLTLAQIDFEHSEFKIVGSSKK